MLNIGDFAQLGGVSIRMLRHYDDLGLLRPADVDDWTGRRRYNLDQLTDLNRIVTLKELGFTLAQIGELLRDGIEPAELRGMLRLRRAELQRQAHDPHHRLAQIDARLRLIESEHAMSAQEVVVKHAEPTRVAALTDLAPPDADFGAFVEELFCKVCDLMDAAGLCRTTPVGRYMPEPTPSENVWRVYAGFAVTGDAPPGLQIMTIPAAEVASVIHHGPMENIGHAYQTLARSAASRDRNIGDRAGTKRLIFLEANGDDQTDWVVEVQLELT